MTFRQIFSCALVFGASSVTAQVTSQPGNAPLIASLQSVFPQGYLYGKAPDGQLCVITVGHDVTNQTAGELGQGLVPPNIQISSYYAGDAADGTIQTGFAKFEVFAFGDSLRPAPVARLGASSGVNTLDIKTWSATELYASQAFVLRQGQVFRYMNFVPTQSGYKPAQSPIAYNVGRECRIVAKVGIVRGLDGRAVSRVTDAVFQGCGGDPTRKSETFSCGNLMTAPEYEAYVSGRFVPSTVQPPAYNPSFGQPMTSQETHARIVPSAPVSPPAALTAKPLVMSVPTVRTETNATRVPQPTRVVPAPAPLAAPTKGQSRSLAPAKARPARGEDQLRREMEVKAVVILPNKKPAPATTTPEPAEMNEEAAEAELYNHP